jgi:hypothetical protein
MTFSPMPFCVLQNNSLVLLNWVTGALTKRLHLYALEQIDQTFETTKLKKNLKINKK